MSKFKSAACTALAAFSILGLSSAYAYPVGSVPNQCFNIRDWGGWTVSPDAKSIYIRTALKDIYRLDFANACHAAQGVGVHLVNRIRGSSRVCGPLDLDLTVSDGHGFTSSCVVSNITPLSSEAAAALPKGLKP